MYIDIYILINNHRIFVFQSSFVIIIIIYYYIIYGIIKYMKNKLYSINFLFQNIPYNVCRLYLNFSKPNTNNYIGTHSKFIIREQSMLTILFQYSIRYLYNNLFYYFCTNSNITWSVTFQLLRFLFQF